MNILVCIDCQNDFITGSLGNTAAVKVLPNIIDKVKSWNGPVIYTMDTHNENYFDTFEGKHLHTLHCIDKTDGWKIESELYKVLQNKENALAFYKITFGDLDLRHLITTAREIFSYNHIEFREEMIKTITLVGYCTDICVIMNAMILRTAFPDVEIVIDASCCSGTTKEAHDAALLIMENCQIKVINN